MGKSKQEHGIGSKEITGYRVEFLSPFRADKCAARLKSIAKEQSLITLSSVRVDIITLDKQMYEYRIVKRMYGRTVANVVGRLNYHTEKSTKVEGEAYISMEMGLIYLGVGLIGVYMLLLMISRGDFSGLFVITLTILIGIINWLRLNKWRKDLLLMIQSILG